MTKSGPIKVFFEGISQEEIKLGKLKEVVNQVVKGESHKTGPINIIFCNDIFLHKINLEYLAHNTLTDVISFDYQDVYYRTSGDIFVSIERVRENAKKNRVSVLHEVNRVVIHGVLHLCGYLDSSPEDKALIREKENYYLNLIV